MPRSTCVERLPLNVVERHDLMAVSRCMSDEEKVAESNVVTRSVVMHIVI